MGMIINPYAFGAAGLLTYSGEVLADSPLSYWRLAELSGTVAADSGSAGVSGTYEGAMTLGQPSLCGEPSDRAVLFAGGYVNLGRPAALELASGFTYEAIIKPSAAGTYRPILAFGYGGFTIRLNNANQLNALKSDVADRGSSSSTFAAGVRAHVAVTVSAGGVLTFYKNGVADGTGGTASDYGSPTSNLYIGTGGFAYQGVIDEVAIYGTALSAGRLLAHATAAGL